MVNYRSDRWLQDCLRSVARHVRGVAYEVVVVDNGSTGGLGETLRPWPEARLIENARNLGFARAVNQGIQASSGRYVLLLNPDAQLLNAGVPDWLRFMDEHTDVGIAGPKVFDDPTKRSVQASCRAFPSFLNVLFSRHSPLTALFPRNRFSRRFLLSDLDRDAVGEVDWVSGCCMLLRRAMLDEVGHLDEGYPLFFEDVDLCFRARRAGWSVCYCPTVEVAHHVGATRERAPFRTVVERHRSLWRYYHKFYGRNALFDSAIFLGVWGRALFLLALLAFKRAEPLLLDAAAIQAAFGLAYGVRALLPFPWVGRAIEAYLDIALPYTLAQLFLLYVFDLYGFARSRYQDYLDVLPRVFKAVSTGSLLLVFFAFFTRQFVLPRSIVLFSWGFNVALLASWRWAALYARQRRRTPKRVLIYGTGTLATLVEDELRRRVSLRCEPVGFVQAGNEAHATVDPDRLLGNVEALEAMVRGHGVDEVVFAPDERSDAELARAMRACQSAHVNTRVAPELFEIVMGTAPLGTDQPAFYELTAAPVRGGYLPLKRGIDLVIAGASLTLLAPLMGLIVLGVKRSSPGPALFRQQRVGWQGREFTLYKFRTMRGELHEGEEDLKRMTPFGRLLRLTRLDELPQLVNVLRGEMSLVGPRAEWVPLARKMKGAIPFFEQRYAVRPGMTGWAQVEFKYTTSVKEYRHKLQYDLYYVKNLSLALDLRILVKTLWVVLTGKGAR